jgi:hypothetical protein
VRGDVLGGVVACAQRRRGARVQRDPLDGVEPFDDRGAHDRVLEVEPLALLHDEAGARERVGGGDGGDGVEAGHLRDQRDRARPAEHGDRVGDGAGFIPERGEPPLDRARHAVRAERFERRGVAHPLGARRARG